MAKRKAISKKVRFEVFKRDSFTCQYCGQKSPDVVLHVDHINPVSKGGENEILNLLTSCESCNQGKSDRLLNDKSLIAKQRAQLDELNERREQLEMMLKWRDELEKFDDNLVEIVVDHLEGLMTNATVNDNGKAKIRKWLKKYSATEILDAADMASEKSGSNDELFNLTPKICQHNKLPEAQQRIRYARGILRNRLSYLNEEKSVELMSLAVDCGADVEGLVDFAKRVTTWSAFVREMEAIING